MAESKVVIVVGGAGLLGRAFSDAAARAGHHVVVADRDAAAAARVADALTASGSAESAAVDIISRVSIDGLIDTLHARHGRIDAVVNSAYPHNANYGRKLEDVSYDDFCENMNMHLGGYFLVAQRFAQYFRGHGGGHIINLASIYGVIAPRFDVYENTPMTMPVEYAAIKSSLIHITRYFACYFGREGVRVNCVSPGGILDNQPQSFLDRYSKHCAGKGMLDVEDITGTVLFLLSDASRHITGQNIVVDDGFTL